MSTVLTRFVKFVKTYPIARGIMAYAVIWPVSSICQQTIAGKRWKTYDWGQAARFCLYGSCFVAPTLYVWIRFSSSSWPRTDIRTALKKALIEQVSYGPWAICCFLFGMSLLEKKTFERARQEVAVKFWPTYKVGVMVWPVLQTINFCFIPERNRVIYVSVCSLMWTSFLAFMKQKNPEEMKTVQYGIPLSHS